MNHHQWSAHLYVSASMGLVRAGKMSRWISLLCQYACPLCHLSSNRSDLLTSLLRCIDGTLTKKPIHPTPVQPKISLPKPTQKRMRSLKQRSTMTISSTPPTRCRFLIYQASYQISRKWRRMQISIRPRKYSSRRWARRGGLGIGVLCML